MATLCNRAGHYIFALWFLSLFFLLFLSSANLSSRRLDVYHTSTHGVALVFCSLAVLNPRVGHTMDVLSPFISILCHSDWLFHRESCPRLDVVYPGHAWSSSPAYTWHCSLHYFFLQAIPLFPHGVTILCSFLVLTVSSSSLFTLALLRTHSFVFFAVHETRRNFLSPFISKASRRVSSFFLSV